MRYHQIQDQYEKKNSIEIEQHNWKFKKWYHLHSNENITYDKSL